MTTQLDLLGIVLIYTRGPFGIVSSVSAHSPSGVIKKLCTPRK